MENPQGPISLNKFSFHFDDVIMDAVASQITNLTIVYSTVYSGADQSKHQSSASLAFVWGNHRGPVNSPHKWPVTRKMFPFGDVIICNSNSIEILAAVYRHLPLQILHMPRQHRCRIHNEHGVTICMRTKQNCHCIWTMVKKSAVKWTCCGPENILLLIECFAVY